MIDKFLEQCKTNVRWYERQVGRNQFIADVRSICNNNGYYADYPKETKKFWSQFVQDCLDSKDLAFIKEFADFLKKIKEDGLMRNKKVNDLKNEIKLIKLDIYENEIIIRKYQKRVEKEKTKEQREKSEYVSLEEVQDAYGYGEISRTEYERLTSYFDGGGTQKSINEMFLEYMERTKKGNIDTLSYLEKELQSL